MRHTNRKCGSPMDGGGWTPAGVEQASGINLWYNLQILASGQFEKCIIKLRISKSCAEEEEALGGLRPDLVGGCDDRR